MKLSQTVQTVIREQAKRYDCFYLYDACQILQQTSRLQAAFPGVEFLYSIKCNPQKQVVRCVLAQGFGADAASLGEVVLAANAGLPRERIYYSAPGKTLYDLRQAADKAILIADSLGELDRLQTVAAERGMPLDIGVRLNPDFSFEGACGQASKFGIDEDRFFAWLKKRSCPLLRIIGIHVHLKSQELRAAAVAAYYARLLRLAIRAQACLGHPLAFLNMGSGIGIPYAPDASPFDLNALGAAFSEQRDAFRAACPQTRLMIEVGRYAVGECGYYVTRVLDRKRSGEKTFLILKNTLNGFVRPSLAQLVRRYTSEEEPAACEPLYTCADPFRIWTLDAQGREPERVTLVGNLCTAADVIAEDVVLPRLDCGDLVVLTHAGSYAAALTPMQFSAQERPAELFLTETGVVIA